MNCRRILASIFVCAVATGSAQTVTDTMTSARLFITSSPESAWVYLDTSFVGRTPCSVEVADRSTRHLRLLHPDFANWLTGGVDDTVRFSPGERLVRQYKMERWTTIVSSPPGAEVLLGDSVLGATPLLIPEGGLSLETPLLVRMRGYDPVVARLAQAQRGILQVPLLARWDPGRPNGDLLLTGNRHSSLRLYVTGAGAILAGAASAYFKVKADDRNNAFLITGNPLLALERKRYDNASAVLLAVTEVSLGLFVAFLLSE